MTVEEKIKEMLDNYGMSEKQGEEITERVKLHKGSEDTIHGKENRWNDPVESYPDIVLKQLWLHTKQVALKYIDENCPSIWSRALFIQKIKEK